MLDKIKIDKFPLGFLLGLGLILISCGLTYLIISLVGRTIEQDPKIFLFSFIPTILLMRWYFKIQKTKSAGGVVVSLVICFFLYSYFLYSFGSFIGNGFHF
ncbi:MAG: hypothetical protein PHV83_07565 [Bacteroidales bacterium]|nr:hypothetical protein [Bacteroidales bacterium]